MNHTDAVKACKEAVKRCEEAQPLYHAMVTFIDPETQLEGLKDLPSDALLYGLPVVLKDNICTNDVKTTASSRILEDFVPSYDACVAKRLKEAGAVIIGKSAMDEMAMGADCLTPAGGPVYNPADLIRVAGGSSGGSAALVACGAVKAAIGTDTGDSVRRPASYCGIVGIKPTYGRISRRGVISYASSLDTVGVCADHVLDAAAVLEAVCGYDPGDMTSSAIEVPAFSKLLSSDVKGMKIAVLGNVVSRIKDPSLKESFDAVVNGLKERGAIIEAVWMDEALFSAIDPAYYIISNCEAASNLSRFDGIRYGLQEEGSDYQEIMRRSRTAGFGLEVRKRLVIGAFGLMKEHRDTILEQAQKVRRLITEDLHKILKEYDGILSPACLHGAPTVKEAMEQGRGQDPAENYMPMTNFSGDPSMSVPCLSAGGLPVGLHIISRAYDEVTMLKIAAAAEEFASAREASQ